MVKQLELRNAVQRLVVASSMSLYGEGLYRDAAGEVRAVGERTLEQLKRGDWEFHDDRGAVLQPAAERAPATGCPAPRGCYIPLNASLTGCCGTRVCDAQPICWNS